MKHEVASRRRQAQAGVTLVEILVALAILGVLATAAWPSMAAWRSLRRLDGAATEYLHHLQWARQQAVLINRPVRLRLGTGTAGCYVFFTGPTDSCQCDAQGTRCADGSQLLLTVTLAASDGVSLGTSGAGHAVLIDPLRGTVSPAITAIFSAGGSAVHQITNLMGRTRTCSPAPAALGLPPC